MTNELALEFPARSGQVALFRRRLTAWLAVEGVDEDTAGDLVLAASEAVSNAVEHAYQGPMAGTVRVRAEVARDGTLCVTVQDFGTWRVPPAAVSSRGRGLLLMRENVDEVAVDRTSAGTTVTLLLGPDTTPSAHGPPEPAEHEVVVHSVTDGVGVLVRGDVPANAGPALRRELTTLARGGAVPLFVDLGEFGAETDGLVDALGAVAEAQSAAGNRLTVRVPRNSPAHRAVEELGAVLDLRN